MRISPHECIAGSSPPWRAASFCVQRAAEVLPWVSGEWSSSFTGTVSRLGVTMLLSAGSVACVGDQDRYITSLATARQPETIILKFSRSVKSVVYWRKAGSLALSALGFKKSSSSEDLYRAVSEVACSFLGLWKHIFVSHSLCGQKHTSKEGPMSSHWPEIPEDVQKK